MNYVNYDEFKKMDMRVGLIRYIEPVEGTDKLLRFEIDFGLKPSTAADDSADQTASGLGAESSFAIKCSGECKKENCKDCDGECTCEITCHCTPTETENPFGKEEYAGRDMRQIVSGIREYWPEYKELEGKYGLYILNLEPREIRGVMSHGMLMAVDGIDGKPVFLGPQGDIEPGAKVR